MFLGLGSVSSPPSKSIFMRQNFSIILCAAVLYLLTNGFYLVKHIIQKTMIPIDMIPIDMIPLYMMVAASLAMLLFLALCKKYDSPLARFALLGYYTMIIASVTIFMVSCNFHGIGLSISMCYLFVIMIAPTYKTLDTVIICVLIGLSWWLPQSASLCRKLRSVQAFSAALFHRCGIYRHPVHFSPPVPQ